MRKGKSAEEKECRMCAYDRREGGEVQTLPVIKCTTLHQHMGDVGSGIVFHENPVRHNFFVPTVYYKECTCSVY